MLFTLPFITISAAMASFMALVMTNCAPAQTTSVRENQGSKVIRDAKQFIFSSGAAVFYDTAALGLGQTPANVWLAH